MIEIIRNCKLGMKFFKLDIVNSFQLGLRLLGME